MERGVQLGHSRATHFPEIDALRAIAISVVVASHATNQLPGGFFGVDIFFVVSGFLITYTSLSAGREKEFDVWQFWRRRIARIVPPLIAVTLAVSFLAWLAFAVETDHRFYFDSLPYQAFFLQNFFFAWEKLNYFQGLETAKLNLHLWSIAIEEQFYLVFPIVAALILARFARPLPALAAVALVALLVSAIWPSMGQPPNARYFLTQYRVWQLSLGVLLALILLNNWMPKRQLPTIWAEILAISALLFAVGRFNEGHASMPSAQWLVCASTAVLIAIAALGNSRVMSTVGRLPPVAWIGQASYSIYLWHWPLFAILSYLAFDFGHHLMDGVIYIVALSVVSYASHQILERRLRPIAGRYAAVTLGAFMLLSIALYSLPLRRSSVEDSLLASARYSDKCAELVCRHGDGSRGLLLWGDSHARALWEAVKRWGDESQRTVYGVFDCTPGRRDKGCEAGYQAALGLARSSQVSDVLLVSRWSMYTVGFPSYEPEEKGQRYFSHGGKTPRNQIEMQSIWKVAMTALAKELEGSKVYVMLQVPQFPYFPPKEAIIDARGLRWRSLPIKTIDQYYREHEVSIEMFESIENFTIIDPAPDLCPKGVCQERKNGKVLYKDDDHLSVAGAALIKQALSRIIK